MLKSINLKLASVLIIIGIVASGCGSSGGGSKTPVVLKVWGTFETSENMQPFIAAFTQKYSNVQIEYTQKNVEDYETDLLNALATGSGPDIYAIHNDWLPKYSDKLSPATDTRFTLKEYKDTFVDVAYNDFVSEGKIYAAPLSVDSLALYYNKDILGSFGIATPPRTWDDLSRDVKKITDKSNRNFIKTSGVALGTTNNINRAVDIMYLMMLQNRTQPYTSDFSQPTFDQSVRDNSGNSFFPGANALDYFTSFSNPNSENYTWNSNSNYSFDAFANGDVAYMYAYSYARDTIRSKAPNLNYDIAPVPQPKSSQTLVNYANYWGFGVSKQSKNPDTSWAFIKAMTAKDSLKDYYKRHQLPAARKDIISDQVNDPDLGVFATANLTAKTFYKKDQAKVDQIFIDMINDVVLRGRAVNQALSNASQRVGLLFNQQR